MLATEWRPQSLRMAWQIAAHAAAQGATPAAFALGWVLNKRLISAVIGGPRIEAQWEDYLAARSYCFTVADGAPVAGLMPSGHASTPGYNDPAYPGMGRLIRV